MTKKEFDEENMSDTPEYRISNIIFEKRNTKVKFIIFIKIISYLISAAILGAIISNAVIKYKYGYIIEQMDEIKNNGDVAIFDYNKIVEEVSPSLVSVSDTEEKLMEDKYFDNNVTGVIIDSSGIILTNYSAIKNDKQIFVKLASAASTPIEAKILIENKDIDLAIIKIDFDGELEPIQIADTDTIREGENIIVLGNAIGDEYIGSAIPGIVTSTSEKIYISNNREHSLLQINAPINIKNDGGAICNSKGELVGLANLKITNEKNEQGIYYGLQLQELQYMISSTNSFKKMLGINEGGIIVEDTDYFSGFYIQELDKKGSAYEAGVKPTDIILTVDDVNITDVEDFISILANKKKGDILRCSVLSDGEIKEIDINITE